MNNNMMNDNEFLSFDGPITAEESQFVTLPEGTYPFQVINMDRKRYSGNSTKIPNGAPFAEVQLRFDGGDKGTTTVTERLYLLKSMQWKLTEFFRCLGQQVVTGQPFQPNWNIVGKTGTAELSVHQYTSRNGEERTNNQVKRFKALEDGTTPQNVAQQQPVQQAQPQPVQQQPQPQQSTGYTPGIGMF